MTTRDRDLGMDRAISRRDFLNGVSIALTGSLAYPWFEAGAQTRVYAPEKAPGYYPPALIGLRGSHAGSFEVAHELRDGKSFDAEATDTGEMYDLVVVGAGISGLAAGYFFQKAAGRSAKILILDNHDDFGGHAKRNEFTYGGRVLIGYGGTQAIEGRRTWSKEAKGVLEDLGIDTDKFFTYFDQKLYLSLGLGQGVFFDKETWGVDRFIRGGQGNIAEGPTPPDGWWRVFAASAPFSDRARQDFIRLHEERVDYLPGLSSDEKRAKLRKVSYSAFLRDYVKVDPQVVAYFQQRTHSGWGIGIDAIPASGAMGLPGLQGMGLRRLSDAEGPPDPYIFHFPDGNASIARMLVRRMIPSVAPGTTMEDIVTARFNYARLDEPGSPVRIRLNSTVVRARHGGDGPDGQEVVVSYVRGGTTYRVRARRSILACYHSVIPALAPELPARQREALLAGVKAPLVYTNVLLRNWTAFHRLGVSHFYGPSTFHAIGFLDFPVSLGEYRNPRDPSEPILVHLVHVPTRPGLPRREQHRAGRYDLLQTSFETFERRTRDQLGRMLSEGGFDPAREIEAITVNRWPHGYADFGDPLTDPEYATDAEKPWVIARQRFGRISIANSDAAHIAETYAAIDEAYRAVQEQLTAYRT